MRRFIVIATVAIAGCSGQPASNMVSDGEPVPPEVTKALENISREQSEGLTDATVIVHRAYEYFGHSWLEPIESARLIGVDVEFRNYKQGLDLDDVDVIDGQSNENYGSDPQIARLTADGNLARDPDDSSWPENLSPLRVLLIYALPKETSTVKLGYWGRELTPKRVPISGNGPSLPMPNPTASQAK